MPIGGLNSKGDHLYIFLNIVSAFKIIFLHSFLSTIDSVNYF